MQTLCICWGLAATIVLLWPRVSSFQQRFPLMVQPPDVYGTARAAIAAVLCAARQMPRRGKVMLALRTADTLIAVLVMAGFGLVAAAAALDARRRALT